MEKCTVMKRNVLIIHTAKWSNLKISLEMFDSIYLTFWKKEETKVANSRPVISRDQGFSGLNAKECEDTMEVMEIVCILIMVLVTESQKFVKIHGLYI